MFQYTDKAFMDNRKHFFRTTGIPIQDLFFDVKR